MKDGRGTSEGGGVKGCEAVEDGKVCGITPVVGRDMCRKHYQRWWKAHPGKAKPFRYGCIVKGCEREHHGNGFLLPALEAGPEG